MTMKTKTIQAVTAAEAKMSVLSVCPEANATLYLPTDPWFICEDMYNSGWQVNGETEQSAWIAAYWYLKGQGRI